MNQYSIFCTKEQTRKALELGAPIEADFSNNKNIMDFQGVPLALPTAEQMIGFFRSKNIHIVIQKDIVDNWSAYGHEISPIEFTVFERLTGYKSYEEAILAGIDAALEHLTNNN